jgi:hypothetical protein
MKRSPAYRRLFEELSDSFLNAPEDVWSKEGNYGLIQNLDIIFAIYDEGKKCGLSKRTILDDIQACTFDTVLRKRTGWKWLHFLAQFVENIHAKRNIEFKTRIDTVF